VPASASVSPSSGSANYDRSAYRALKDTYDAGRSLPNLYAKVVLRQ